VSIGDDATYVVRADSVGLVQMVSQSGHGIWIDVTPGSKDLTATFGSVQVHWVRATIAFDQETKVFSFAGEWAISLKDDAPDPGGKTPTASPPRRVPAFPAARDKRGESLRAPSHSSRATIETSR